MVIYGMIREELDKPESRLYKRTRGVPESKTLCCMDLEDYLLGTHKLNQYIGLNDLA